MKNYFKFNLTGKQIFPIWIIFTVLFIIPYIIVQVKMQTLNAHGSEHMEALAKLGKIAQLYGIMIILLIVEYAILFFIGKLAIEAIEFKEKSLKFIGTYSKFLLILIPGFLFTIITLGIYGPWYTTNLFRFFAKNSSHDDNKFEFTGKGSDLFLITLFSVVLPFTFFLFVAIIVVFTLGLIGLKGAAVNPSSNTSIQLFAFIFVLGVMFLLIPYFYYSTKWKISFKIKGYIIQWETNFWDSAKKMALEISLSTITLGIYAPLAMLKLFKYFGERTIATSATSRKKFGYDIEPKDDFLFIWGQSLLSIITFGIYCP